MGPLRVNNQSEIVADGKFTAIWGVSRKTLKGFLCWESDVKWTIATTAAITRP